MNNVFATTSWRARVGTNLPLVLKNIIKQSYKLDKIQVYLSLEEFPYKENDLPKNLLEVVESDKRIELIWTRGNLKSFKRLLSIKNNPNSNLCIYDDDTIHGTDWLKVGFTNLIMNGWVNYSRWVGLSCEDRELTKIKHYRIDNYYVPNYYNTSMGFFINTNNYRNIELDFELPVRLGINDDDYYFHMLNVINHIKSCPYEYLGKRNLLTQDSDMRNSHYTHKAVLEYWRDFDKKKFDEYFHVKEMAFKDLFVIDSKELF